MEAQRFDLPVVLNVVTCCQCGTPFGIESRMHQFLKEYKGEFYCPNGHKQWYGVGEVEELKKELTRAVHERSQAKAALTRLSNRIAFGVCPCCHRHFTNLQRHMASQHPDFLRSGDTPVNASAQEEVTALPQSELMSVTEAAKFKNCTNATIRYAITRHRLPAVLKVNKFFVARKDVEALHIQGYGNYR